MVHERREESQVAVWIPFNGRGRACNRKLIGMLWMGTERRQMSTKMIRMTFAWPEQLRETVVDGRRVLERVPNHPTRPARDWESNTWLEPCEANDERN
jgi:hypothetical protein